MKQSVIFSLDMKGKEPELDSQGFRTLLESRKVPAEKLDAALALAERFENYAQQAGSGFSAESAWAFSKLLIEEGQNTEENFFTLARYGLFIKSQAVYVAFVESLDGGEAQENLYHRVAERFGEMLRDEVFAEIGVAPFGLPTPEKPRYMHPVIARLEQAIGPDACRELLSSSLRDLPDEYFVSGREAYQSCKNIDEYLVKKKQEFVEQLEACQRDKRLFFAQEITDEVLMFVRSEPEMGGGVRDGNVIYETKIPYMAKQYLEESDVTLKRYFYCHCPWAREAIKSGEKVAPIFCSCSAGFHKKPWEIIFGRTLQVEVLESVLQGDLRCRFAIHLPEGLA
jgi:hypothetical protein